LGIDWVKLLSNVELSQVSKDRQTQEFLVAAYMGITLKRQSLTSHLKTPQVLYNAAGALIEALRVLLQCILQHNIYS